MLTTVDSPDTEPAEDLLSTVTERADARGVVVPLDGTAAASVACELAACALGPDRVAALLLPRDDGDDDVAVAREHARDLGVDAATVPLRPLLGVFSAHVAPSLPGDVRDDLDAFAERLRLACTYYVANATGRLVVGAASRTDRLLGARPRWGNGTGDVLPLGDLSGTEVLAAARDLDPPMDSLAAAAPPGPVADRETRDDLLAALAERGLDPAAAADCAGVAVADAREMAARIDTAASERGLPPGPSTRRPTSEGDGTRTAGQVSRATDRGALAASLAEHAAARDADGVVVNVSGGVDSSVAATLAADALGADSVTALHLPCFLGRPTYDAANVADALGATYASVNLHPLVERVERALPDDVTNDAGTTPTGNLVARLRTACAYAVAEATDRLVVGTTNRSEWLLGYVTKYGDGVGDLQVLRECYKRDVRALARDLDLPEQIVEQAPSAGFHAGQTDEADLGAPYDAIDPVLESLVAEDVGIAAAADALDADAATVRRIATAHADTRHKRSPPPTPSSRTIASRPDYFHELELSFE